MKPFYIAVLFIILSLSSFAQIPAFRTTVFDSSLTGFYFLSGGGTAIILDRTGNVVYYMPGLLGGGFCLQPNGMMSYGAGLGFNIMDSTFTVVDSVAVKNLDEMDKHELQILPNGHFLMLGNDHVIMDLSSYFWHGQYGSDSTTVIFGVVQEQDANHNVVFEWHARDHFIFDEADTFFLDHSPLLTWTHCNAVELDIDGNFLLSNRDFNEIIKINRADSSIMWRLGGTQNQFTFVNSPVPFYGQHDIRRIGNGDITLFDNGNNYTPHGARALEFHLDEVNKIATQVWSYTFDSAAWSYSQGNVQRLHNSNTLVNFGNYPNDSVTFVVVDSSGSRIFELDDLVSYRAFHYSSLPWQLHRPEITCFDSLGVTYLDAGAGYASYVWSNGGSTQIIHIPAAIGTYHVFVPYGQDGFISSEQFIVTDTSNMCGTLAVPEIKSGDSSHLHVFPNPAHDLLTVSIDAKEQTVYTIQLADAEGREVQRETAKAAAGENLFRLNISALDKGIYILTVQSAVNSRKAKVVVE
jgi:hypothetical protein